MLETDKVGRLEWGLFQIFKLLGFVFGITALLMFDVYTFVHLYRFLFR